jgi:sulfite dehydrogenase (quinone) subunit SoeC
MNPPWSMIIFTTLAGAAQGLLIALAALQLAGGALAPSTVAAGTVIVLLMSMAGLVAASFHLGRPMRAWRAAAMWRTSWLSREVIVLPLFMAVVAAWGALQLWGDGGASAAVLGAAVLAIVLALGLYLCTGMIYAAVAAIREWAHPVTVINFALLGLASGCTLAAAVAAWQARPEAVETFARWALMSTIAGAATRGWALWRNLNLAPKVTPQSATGLRHPSVRQISQGAMGGSFNTREFMHGQSAGFVSGMRWGAAALAFAVPVLALAVGTRSTLALSLLALVQLAGLVAERWSFFAEARHPQNHYTRAVG